MRRNKKNVEKNVNEEIIETMYEGLKENKNVFGNMLKVARKYKGYTQQDVAKNIGVDVSTISRYESGQYTPSYDKFKKLLKVL